MAYILTTTTIHPDTVKAFDQINPIPLRIFLGTVVSLVALLVVVGPWFLVAKHGYEVLQKELKGDAEATKKLVGDIEKFQREKGKA